MPSPLLPGAIAPASYEFTPVRNILSTRTDSQRILTRGKPGQMWEAKLVFPPMSTDDANYLALSAFVGEQQDENGIFFVLVPQRGASAGAAGEFINYSTHTKLYRVAANGVDTYPAPVVAGGTAVINPVYLRCSLKNKPQKVTYSDDGIERLEINLVERI